MMDANAARHALFGDSLTVTQVRPSGFNPCPIDATSRQAALGRAGTLLRSLAVIDESMHEDHDEIHGSDGPFRRLEAKLDLLTSLVASMARARGDVDAHREVTWSALGAEVVMPAPHETGAEGFFHIVLFERLPERIALPARVICCEPEGAHFRLFLQFEQLGGPVHEELDRHLFRVDRRAIADRRWRPANPG
jgi:hypothetical protein